MTDTRIYVVESATTLPVTRLVEATSAAQAIRHCVKSIYKVKAATPKDVVSALTSGLIVEYADQTKEKL